MRAFLKKIAGKSGKAPASDASAGPEIRLGADYEHRLEAIITASGNADIVIVGANDGRINDPFYNTARRFADRTRVVLIEPQKHLHPVLRDNYAFHENCILVEGAIGKASVLKLFCIRKGYWPVLQPAYARRNSWPEYRAPTGITSSVRAEVEDWIAR